jgi:uncharacterized protein YndB with AHSA1/START domain
MRTTVGSWITIDRSPEDVARVLLDPDRAPLWNTGLERFEVLTEASGLVGSRARLHFLQAGRHYVMEDEMLEVTPNRRFLSRVSGDALEAEVETLLDSAGRTTLVTVRWSGRGKKPLLRVALPLMRRRLARQIRVDLGKLKRVVEGD